MTKNQERLYLQYHSTQDQAQKFEIARLIIESQKEKPIPEYWKNKSLVSYPGEEWRPLNINGFGDFFMVSSFGRVKRLFRYVKGHYRSVPKRWEKCILTGNDKGNGRLRHRLRVDRLELKIEIHRCVALIFLDNPDNLPQVNHIDGNPLNNHYLNLEWSTPSHNLRHSFRVLNRKRDRPTLSKSPSSTGKIGQYSLDGELIKEFSCIKEATLYGFNSGHISNVIHGKRKTHANYIWKSLVSRKRWTRSKNGN